MPIIKPIQQMAFCRNAIHAAMQFDASITQVVQVSNDEVQCWQNQLEEQGTTRKFLGPCLVIQPEGDWIILHNEYLTGGAYFIRATATKVSEVEMALSQRSQDNLLKTAYSDHLTAHEYLRRMTGDPSAKISIGHEVKKSRK